MSNLAISPKQKVADVRNFLNSAAVKKQIINALPAHLTPERMMRVINTAITNTPKLADCSRDSLIMGIITASELGLEVNTPLGEAYLIPYGNEVKCIIGYRGFISLARRSGEISYAVSEIVYANDKFRISLGTTREIEHEPLLTGNRGEPIGVYSLVVYRDGERDFEYMSADDVEKVRKRSKASSNGPWVTDTMEMWRKTPMRRHAKRWPMTAEDRERVVRDEASEYTDYGMNDAPAPVEYISQEQRQALVAAGKEAIPAVLKEFGFATMADIPTDRYEDVLSAIKNANSVDAEPVEEAPQAAESEPSPEPANGERKALLHALEETVVSVGEMTLSGGQKKRYNRREELTDDEIQALIDEVTPKD